MLKITIIGIDDNKPAFSNEQEVLISASNYFAGGERLFHLVKEYLPEEHCWISITVPLTDLFENMREKRGQWIVFASGDPWFFGIANTLKREFPEASIMVFPLFNSLQTLGHRLEKNYGEYKTISLTGRPWQEFDKALITGEHRMAILTDRKKTPASIAKRMLTYGYSNYTMQYGEHLGGIQEQIKTLKLEEALSLNFKHPNCLFLDKTDKAFPKKLIPENEFMLLDNRPNMITKMPVRLSTLASMELETKTVLWDIGACTGSISIEARLNYPDLQITAFELHQERMLVLEKNCKRFQCPGINLLEGDYLQLDKALLSPPDAVFLGGYSGKMEEMLDDISTRLSRKGIISFNSVSETSEKRFLDWAGKNNYAIIFHQLIQVDSHNPIQIITIEKK